MSDFDPDAHLDSSASESFDPDAHLDSPATQAAVSAPEPTLWQKLAKETSKMGDVNPIGAMVANQASSAISNIGAGAKVLYQTATGKIHSIREAHESSDEFLKNHPALFAPQQGSAQEVISNAAASPYNPLNYPTALADKGGELVTQGLDAAGVPGNISTIAGPVAGGVGNIVANAVAGKAADSVLHKFAPGLDRVPDAIPPPDAQALADRSFSQSAQSMGAAAAAPDLSRASPELKQAIADAAQSGKPLNADVLNRRLQADTLPVKINLTEGQATRDPTLFSREQNDRARQPLLAAHFNDQGEKLVQNLDAIRENVGPDVFTNNPVDHAETVINAYKEKAASADAVTSQKYKALKDANGGQFPVDAQQLLDNASTKLHKELLFDHAPKAIMSTLNRLADSGNMTFENFESLRTNLARIQRSLTADGNEKAAAGIIRQTMEDLPLSPGSARLKPLADSARASAKAQFDALDADPAYKAAVTDSVSADKFAQKHILGASRENAKIMRDNLQHDPQALQAMGVTVVDHLRNAAGIDANGNGVFGQARFNKQLNALRPKLDSFLEPEHIENLQALGDVARNVKEFPPGHSVNTSNTFTAAAGEHAAGALEGVVNVAAKGLPVGTVGRKLLQGRAARKAAEASLGEGAGLTYRPTKLSDLAKRTSP